MNKLMGLTLIAGTVLGHTGVALAEEFEPTPTSNSSKVKTEVIPGDDLIDPGPGPGPIDPPEPNPETDVYGIRYISNLDFGKMKFSTESQNLLTKFDADLVAKEGEEGIPSYVLVRDIRPEAERSGWHLTVNQDSEFIPGSSLTFSPAFSENSAGFTAEDLQIPATLSISQSPAVFMSTATANNPAGVGALVEIGEAELVVPANTGVGEYSTNLVWNLIAGPDEA